MRAALAILLAAAAARAVPPDARLEISRRAPRIEKIQAEARAAQAELEGAGLRHVQLALGPFGVRLKGARDDAEKRRALRAIWPAILGPLRVEQ